MTYPLSRLLLGLPEDEFNHLHQGLNLAAAARTLIRQYRVSRDDFMDALGLGTDDEAAHFLAGGGTYTEFHAFSLRVYELVLAACQGPPDPTVPHSPPFHLSPAARVPNQ